jgi:crotonobetainyl-CoA:carnitine CoA-transferase CaiB-like acyl-CoA transferase
LFDPARSVRTVAARQAFAIWVSGARGALDHRAAFPTNEPNALIVAADMASSLTALSAILMALLARERTAEAAIDVAMRLVVAWTPNVVGSVFGEDRAPEPHKCATMATKRNRIYEPGWRVRRAGRQRGQILRVFCALDVWHLDRQGGPAQRAARSNFRPHSERGPMGYSWRRSSNCERPKR